MGAHLSEWLFGSNGTNFLIMLFTGALTWVAFRQHKLERELAAENKDTLAIAKQSADAATDGAKATAALAAAGARTAEEAARANYIAELNARAQARAYVEVEEATLIGMDLKAAAVRFLVVNTGQTPATFFEVGCIAEIIPNTSKRVSVIPKRLKMNRWHGLGVRPLTADVHCADFKGGEPLRSDGSNMISVRGRVVYADIFGDVWFSEFSFFRRLTDGHPANKLSSAHSVLRMFQPWDAERNEQSDEG